MKSILTTRSKNNTLRRCILLVLATFLVIPVYVSAEEDISPKTLIIYYSRTGKTQLISKILNRYVNADLLELKDPKDRSGNWPASTSRYAKCNFRNFQTRSFAKAVFR